MVTANTLATNGTDGAINTHQHKVAVQIRSTPELEASCHHSKKKENNFSVYTEWLDKERNCIVSIESTSLQKDGNSSLVGTTGDGASLELRAIVFSK